MAVESFVLIDKSIHSGVGAVWIESSQQLGKVGMGMCVCLEEAGRKFASQCRRDLMSYDKNG
jgi:hypothetical protein